MCYWRTEGILIELHDSQTLVNAFDLVRLFSIPIELHDSQTSNFEIGYDETPCNSTGKTIVWLYFA